VELPDRREVRKMNDKEKEFENLVRDVRFDDTPDYNHRKKLEQNLLHVLAKQERLEQSASMYDKSETQMKTYKSIRARTFTNPLVRKVAFQIVEVAAIVALTLSIGYWFLMPEPEINDDSATINFYLREHRDVVARTASLNLSPPQPERMLVSRHDILYYEFLDDRLEFMHPGIIVRGPSSQRKVIPPEAPAISNGHTLTLSEARKNVNFDLVSPPWLHPGYMLDKIRKIEGRDALQLLYTDGVNTISLFEQPLDGQRGLAVQDFREYAVYRNKGQAGGVILAWRDDALSYVLIGNAEMSQLMDMAQSISASK
jgi:hypothetical protein